MRLVIYVSAFMCTLPLFAVAEDVISAPEMPAVVSASAFNASFPVDVVSDELVYNHDDGEAVFSGSVVIKRDQMTLKADLVTVSMMDNDIDTIVATGDVSLSQGRDVAVGEKATFLPKEEKIYITGNVQLVREGSSLAGERLVYDLGTGEMSLKSKSSGRVRASFTLKSKD